MILKLTGEVGLANGSSVRYFLVSAIVGSVKSAAVGALV